MNETVTVEPPPALDEIPILLDLDDPIETRRRPRRPSTGHHLADTSASSAATSCASTPRRPCRSPISTGRQVVELRRRASEAITEEAAEQPRSTGRPLTGDDRLLMGRATIRRVVGDHVRALHRDGAELWSPAQEQAYVTAVEDAVFGYGRLQPLLQLPDVENIEIHGWNSVMVQYGDGRRERMPPVADSDEELVEAIRFLGQNSEPSRPFDDTHPTMTLALGERFRLHAIGFGLSYRPSIVIRQHTLTDVSLADLAEGGLMPYEVAEFLDAAILARKSMVISGDQGAGKTTLLRALINSIPANERFGTLETDYELMTHLQPGRENILALQARVGHGETSGGVPGRRRHHRRPDARGPPAEPLPPHRRRGPRRRGGAPCSRPCRPVPEPCPRPTRTPPSRPSTGSPPGSPRAACSPSTRPTARSPTTSTSSSMSGWSTRPGRAASAGATSPRSARSPGRIENGRPVTHLTYSATGTPGQPAGFFPDADFEAELLPFRRDLPRAPPGGADHDRHRCRGRRRPVDHRRAARPWSRRTSHRAARTTHQHPRPSASSGRG